MGNYRKIMLTKNGTYYYSNLIIKCKLQVNSHNPIDMLETILAGAPTKQIKSQNQQQQKAIVTRTPTSNTDVDEALEQEKAKLLGDSEYRVNAEEQKLYPETKDCKDDWERMQSAHQVNLNE